MKYLQALKYAYSFCVFGFQGELSSSAKKRMEELFEKGVSGFIFFKRNIKSFSDAEVLYDFCEKRNNKLFTMIDQEGGRSVQLPSEVFRGLNQMAYTAVNSKDIIGISGEFMASDLKRYGINTLLGPVVDVNSEYTNPIIGIRSFSDDEETVAQNAYEFCKGVRSNGVRTVLKHFPGHGPVNVDSHKALPECSMKSDELFEVHIKPFKRLIESGSADMIMSAHIKYSEIDTLPASLSKRFLCDILRDELCFEGITITDCLEMNAISENFDIPKAAVLALKNGNDLILISHTEKTQLDTVKAIAREIFEGGIDKSVVKGKYERIEKMKSTKLKRERRDVFLTESHKDRWEKELVEKSIFRINTDNTWKAKRELDLIAVKNDDFGSASVNCFYGEFYERISKIVKTNYFLIDFQDIESASLNFEFANRKDCIFISDCRGVFQSRKISEFFNKKLIDYKYKIVLSISDPYDYTLLENYDEYYALFGCAKYSAETFLDFLIRGKTNNSVFPLKKYKKEA